MAKKSKQRTAGGPIGWVERADIRVVKTLKPALKHPAARTIGAFGDLGDEPPLLALSASLLVAGALRRDRRLARAGVRMLAAQIVAIGLKSLGKNNIDRSRPKELAGEGRYESGAGKSRAVRLRSFPSGHSAGAVATARALGREYPRLARPSLGVASLIGMLQLPRRAHFPSDIAVGALLGALAELLVDRGARMARS